jgi:hypothetical protein
MFFVLDAWLSAPVAYSPTPTWPKSQIFNIGHDYALCIRNFMVMMKKSEGGLWPKAIIRPKSQNSNIKHDGILSIGKFHADDK